MLKKINAGRVESDDGFSVHITGLETLKYEENNKYVVFDWALDPKTKKIRIYVSDARSWSSEGRQILVSEDKVRIKQNIKQAVALLDGDFEVI